MRTFKENLGAFEAVMGFSDSDIMELSGLSETELLGLKAGKMQTRILSKFCVKMETDYSSLYTDRGFVQKKLDAQYDRFPSELKNMVTRKVCSSVATVFGSEEAAENYIKEKLPNMKIRIARWFSGNSNIGTSEIELLRSKLSDRMTAEEFDLLLANAMYSRIPNYNFNKARKFYRITYDELSNRCDTSYSGLANWGCTKCASIPKTKLKMIASILGDFSLEEFSTIILTDKDFSKRQCELSFGSKLIDPPTDEIVSQTDKIKNEGGTKEEIEMTEENIISAVSAPEEAKINFDDEKLAKMYKMLSPQSKEKVNNLITNLFFEEL